MYDGSLRTKSPWQALVTLQQLIILANKHGEVDKTAEAISIRTGIPLEVIALGISELEKPDPDSRSPDEEGRRIVRIDPDRAWGWRLVNHEHYRKMRSEDERREYQRNLMRDRRAKEKQEREAAAAKSAGAEPQSAEAGSGTTAPALAPVSNVSPYRGSKQEAEAGDAVVVVGEPAEVIHISTPSNVEKSDSGQNGTVPANLDAVTEGLSIQERAVKLTAALNLGLHDNPDVGESVNPALPFSGSAIGAVEALEAQGITLEWARQHVYAIGKSYKPAKPGDTISSLAYCVPRLERPWARHLAKTHAATSERPPEPRTAAAEGTGHPPANNGNLGRRSVRDLKGEGLIVFGKLVAGVHEAIVWDRPDDPDDRGGNRMERQIRAEVLAELTPAGRAALNSLPGGARAITHPRDEKQGAEVHRWAFAQAYAAAVDAQGEP